VSHTLPQQKTEHTSSEETRNRHRDRVVVSLRRRPLITFAFVSLFALSLILLLGWQLMTPYTDPSTGAVSSPLIGHQAPDFTLPALSASPLPDLHLASLRGHIVIINFWASWCDVCKQEAPLLQENWQQERGHGVIFLGVDYGDTQSAGMGFLQHYHITYPNVRDATGSTAINYGVTGVPETYYLSSNGVVVQKVIGALTQNSIQQSLQRLR
jgi:cytochrome c biogenesis protein CcmG, thiol:disulfide interchange protein DsbE